MSFNILIVDDSPLARRIVRRILDISGLPLGTVHEAGDGAAALELLEGTWVDVVFADINMPVMNGHQMIERMAANPVLAGIPVIVVSTERSETRIEQLCGLGVRAYLTKPLTPGTMREAVFQVLGFTAGEPQ